MPEGGRWLQPTNLNKSRRSIKGAYSVATNREGLNSRSMRATNRYRLQLWGEPFDYFFEALTSGQEALWEKEMPPALAISILAC